MLCRPETVPNQSFQAFGDYPRIKLHSPAACCRLKVFLVTHRVDDPQHVRITCLLIFIALPTLSPKQITRKAENWNIILNNNIDVVLSRRLCAPIASLDCMEEFSGNTGLDLSINFWFPNFAQSLLKIWPLDRTIRQPWIQSIAEKCFVNARW